MDRVPQPEKPNPLTETPLLSHEEQNILALDTTRSTADMIIAARTSTQQTFSLDFAHALIQSQRGYLATCILDKFNSSDHKAIAEKLIQKGDTDLVLLYLNNFTGLANTEHLDLLHNFTDTYLNLRKTDSKKAGMLLNTILQNFYISYLGNNGIEVTNYIEEHIIDKLLAEPEQDSETSEIIFNYVGMLPSETHYKFAEKFIAAGLGNRVAQDILILSKTDEDYKELFDLLLEKNGDDPVKNTLENLYFLNDLSPEIQNYVIQKFKEKGCTEKDLNRLYYEHSSEQDQELQQPGRSERICPHCGSVLHD